MPKISHFMLKSTFKIMHHTNCDRKKTTNNNSLTF